MGNNKVHLDAGENADWIKMSWDLPADTEWVLHNIIAVGEIETPKIQSKIDRFMRTGTGRSMPNTMRVELRHRGFRVADRAP